MQDVFMRCMLGAVAASSLAVSAAAVPAQAQSATARPVIQTDSGPVMGIAVQNENIFYGIPYAAPPVGDLRLAAPAPAAVWTKPRLATVRPSPCPQLASPDPAGLASNTEDCLYLNVWSPKATAKPRPVMVWIHGGGFVEGYGAAPEYDAARLAAHAGAVVVTVNYRLGALGFLAASALDAASPQHVSGNYALLDVQAALRWVNHNAAAFGGDPHRITVIGESAGANLTLALLASPASQGLFERAIVQSSTDGAHTVPLAQAETQTYAGAFAALGCTPGAGALACLRAAPVQAFLLLPIKPTLVQDGHVLPLDPFQAFQDGKFVRVPVMIGSNAYENYLFTARTESAVLHRPLTGADLSGQLQAAFGKGAAAVAQAYPASHYVNTATLLGAALTDRRFSCMANLARMGMSRYAPVFGYQLDIADPAQQQPLTHPSDLPNVSYHTTDLGYVFDNDDNANPLSGRDAALSSMMMSYWASFAAEADPSKVDGSARVPWPRFAPEMPQLLSLSDRPVVFSTFAAEHHCGFWEQSGMVAPTWH